VFSREIDEHGDGGLSDVAQMPEGRSASVALAATPERQPVDLGGFLLPMAERLPAGHRFVALAGRRDQGD
jgi:hypothetical protein